MKFRKCFLLLAMMALTISSLLTSKRIIAGANSTCPAGQIVRYCSYESGKSGCPPTPCESDCLGLVLNHFGQPTTQAWRDFLANPEWWYWLAQDDFASSTNCVYNEYKSSSHTFVIECCQVQPLKYKSYECANEEEGCHDGFETPANLESWGYVPIYFGSEDE